MMYNGPLSPLDDFEQSGTTAYSTEAHKPLRSLLSFDADDEDGAVGVMDHIDQAALAFARSPPTDTDSEWSSPQTGFTHRLRVPHSPLDDIEDAFVSLEPPRVSKPSSERTVTDMAPMALPATRKRGTNEVDVAAEGIPLEVRRFQCTKSTLALQEATKNDATPQSAKLLDYLVSLTLDNSGLCTEKEMCGWLVAQMCDRMATGQVWVVAKTSLLLFTLLWRGSNTFVAAVHDYGAAMFQASHLTTLLKSTPQENPSGERLPSSRQPIVTVSPVGGAGGRAPVPLFPSAACRGVGGAARSATAVPDERTAFLISNVAYLESLCEYRMRHPTLDLTRGEIVALGIGYLGNNIEGNPRLNSPAVWKELLDDTLELMKAIAVTDPTAPTCAITTSVATMRLKNAVLLYQVACRALVRLLHSVITASHTFVASMQAGLLVQPPTRSPSGTPATPSSTNSGKHVCFGKTPCDRVSPDFSLTPDVVHGFLHEYYYGIYQFNRTVNMLRAYCDATSHVNAETSARALSAFKMLPEAALREFKLSRKKFSHPVYATMTKLHQAAQQCVEGKDSEFTTPAATPATTIASASQRSASEASSHPATHQNPLADEEVQECLLEIYEYYTANRGYREKLWRHQVQAVCELFDARDAHMLHEVFGAGLADLWQQWQEFTNNGAAAAEKALGQSADTEEMAGSGDTPRLHGLSISDGTFAADRPRGYRDSSPDSLLRSSTYILRSLPSGVRLHASFGSRPDIITLNTTAVDNSTEHAIDALLLEDDVVVICNEECSCNDKLRLVDRFHVLMDVPMGQGNYGCVYRAWDEAIGCYLAVKELPLDASKAHNIAVREVLQEYTVLTELSHPNIVRVVAFMVLKQTARIYMEWVPSGSLQDVLRHHPRRMLRENVVRRYARDVLSGLAFLHSRGVIHRDVKPGNMLLTSDGAVKLTDFGTSLVLKGNNHTLQSDVITGTAAYMAPESMQGMQSSASDIWSFGCSVVQLIGGQVPWYNPATKCSPEPIALLFKIGSLNDDTQLERPHDALKAAGKAVSASQDSYSMPSSLSAMPSPSMGLSEVASEVPASGGSSDDAVSAELLEMLDAIFVVDRKKRPSASELLQHPFFKME